MDADATIRKRTNVETSSYTLMLCVCLGTLHAHRRQSVLPLPSHVNPARTSANVLEEIFKNKDLPKVL